MLSNVSWLEPVGELMGLVEIDDELAFAFCWHDFLSYSYRFAVFGSSARALTRGQLADTEEQGSTRYQLG